MQPPSLPVGGKELAAFIRFCRFTSPSLDNAQENIVLKQTELGGRMNAVESTKNFLADSSVYTNELRSQLQAAQQSFAQVSQPSLFDRL